MKDDLRITKKNTAPHENDSIELKEKSNYRESIQITEPEQDRSEFDIKENYTIPSRTESKLDNKSVEKPEKSVASPNNIEQNDIKITSKSKPIHPVMRVNLKQSQRF